MAKAIHRVETITTKVYTLKKQLDLKTKQVKDLELKSAKDQVNTLSKEVKELRWLKKIMNYETLLTDEDNSWFLSMVEDRKRIIPWE